MALKAHSSSVLCLELDLHRRPRIPERTAVGERLEGLTSIPEQGQEGP